MGLEFFSSVLEFYIRILLPKVRRILQEGSLPYSYSQQRLFVQVFTDWWFLRWVDPNVFSSYPDGASSCLLLVIELQRLRDLILALDELRKHQGLSRANPIIREYVLIQRLKHERSRGLYLLFNILQQKFFIPRGV